MVQIANKLFILEKRKRKIKIFYYISQKRMLPIYDNTICKRSSKFSSVRKDKKNLKRTNEQNRNDCYLFFCLVI